VNCIDEAGPGLVNFLYRPDLAPADHPDNVVVDKSRCIHG
jgi:hypothetical protein